MKDTHTKIQNPTPTNKPPEGSKNEMEEEKILRQALHILSSTHQEATGPLAKGAI